jgi:sterol desaturase/sphingolipid hydroxylase (fatty acid hydroxylase superfamily)
MGSLSMFDGLIEKAERFFLWGLKQLSQIVFNGESRFHWIYLLSFVVSALAIYLVAAWRQSGLSFKGFFGFLFPKDVYLTRSARLDLELFFINRIISPVRFLLPFMSTAFVAGFVLSWLTAGFGDIDPLVDSTWWTVLIFTIGVMAMSDLGEYVTHRIHHEIPILWTFHKVHHSAEVLTPMTAHRMHPVYDISDIIIRSAFSGTFQGVFVYLTVGDTHIYTLLGANALLALYFFFGSHFRHSHIWVSWGPVLSHIFISPAQHQIHHSYLPQHLNKNYSDLFALWDWMFGTLYVPKGKEDLKLGVGEQPHETLWDAYTVPFVECYTMWRLGPAALFSFKALARLQEAAEKRDQAAANANELKGAA